jgi:hypothetical protein
VIVNSYEFVPPAPVGSAWESVIAGYAPLVWLKGTESNAANFIASGNWGSGGGNLTISNVGGGTGVTFGNPGFMPSDTSRPCMNVASGNGYIRIGSISPAVTMTNFCIYYPYEGTTGNPAIIAWRDNVTTQNFIRFDGASDVTVRLSAVDYSTGYPVASVMDGNPHLLAVVVNASGTNAELWVDGVKRWNGAVSSSGTLDEWFYLQNGPNSNQKPYGAFSDFIIFNSALTAPDHVAIYNAWVTP